MRLTCPNCEAHYEVPDEVVPTTGRDVQCSNCGETWFQHHPDHPPAEDETKLEEEPTSVASNDDAAPSGDDEQPAMPPRKELDPAVARILQQEAETEQAARAKEASDQAGDTEQKPETKQTTDKKESDQSIEAVAAAAAAASRLEQEEDKKRTKAGGKLSAPDPAMDKNRPQEKDIPTKTKRRRGGFKTGFFLMCLLATIAALLYVFAPKLADAIPQLRPQLEAYVVWVNELRLWVDTQIQNFLSWLDSLSASNG